MTAFTLKRRSLLALLAALPATRAQAALPGRGPFDPARGDLVDLAAALRSGRLSCAAATRHFLGRIRLLDRQGPQLRAVAEVNPEATALAQALDRVPAQTRKSLHGLPILVKENLDSADRMKTTAGSLALMDAPTPREDAFVVQRLRRAGALLLGKANLSEWANFRSTHPSSGWSSRTGQTRNPHVLDRSPSGSSSGSAAAVAARLCAGAIGTETDGSITGPAACCGIVGLKPTLGLVSRAGIIPLAHSQDTAGPMTHSVRDTALLLDALAGEDPRDPATAACRGRIPASYGAELRADGLKGARLGLLKPHLGRHAAMDRVIEKALKVLQAQGAELVEVALESPWEAAEGEVLFFEFKADLETYLRGRGGPLKTLAEVIAWNEAHADRVMPWFGQELFHQAQAKGPLTDPAYLKALEACRQARKDLEGLLATHRLDALVAPTCEPAAPIDLVNGERNGPGCTSYAAVAGTPHLTVPAGQVHGLPVGLSFLGAAWEEARLLRLGHAFEMARGPLPPPRFLATLG